jgi:hypothetical protein
MRELKGFDGASTIRSDVVMTPRWCAKSIVEHFKPTGRVLDPCRGFGAFSDHMPGCEWCEISEGRDFFAWTEPVDWIVSNPPYAIYSKFMRHAMTLANEIVWLIPINKAWNSDRSIRDVFRWGGIVETMVVGPGSSLDFPVGFSVGAVHFRKGYRGPMSTSFLGG